MKKISLFLVALLAVLGFFAMPANHANAEYYTGLCIPHTSQQCISNAIYSMDSCGNQQEMIQNCPNGCNGNTCQDYNNGNNSYNNYGQCNEHAYKDCMGDQIYWFDSCGNGQEMYLDCAGTNQICKYGQCMARVMPKPVYVPAYVQKKPAAKTTAPKQQAQQPANQCGNDTCDVSAGETPQNCPQDCQTTASGLAVSLLEKTDQNSQQWNKTAEVGPNGTVYFMVAVTNNSQNAFGNVKVAAQIPSEVAYLGNVQINGAPVSGDIVAGIDIGQLSPGTSKTITFEGKTQAFSSQASRQASASATVGQVAPQTDSATLNLNPNLQPQAAVSTTQQAPGFLTFLKRWYVWIFVAIVLIFLFVVIFRRLSA